MKDNKEFINDIYKKYDEYKTKEKNKMKLRIKYISYVTVLATVVIVSILGINIKKVNNNNENPVDVQEEIKLAKAWIEYLNLSDKGEGSFCVVSLKASFWAVGIGIEIFTFWWIEMIWIFGFGFSWGWQFSAFSLPGFFSMLVIEEGSIQSWARSKFGTCS